MVTRVPGSPVKSILNRQKACSGPLMELDGDEAEEMEREMSRLKSVRTALADDDDSTELMTHAVGLCDNDNDGLVPIELKDVLKPSQYQIPVLEFPVDNQIFPDI